MLILCWIYFGCSNINWHSLVNCKLLLFKKLSMNGTICWTSNICYNIFIVFWHKLLTKEMPSRIETIAGWGEGWWINSNVNNILKFVYGCGIRKYQFTKNKSKLLPITILTLENALYTPIYNLLFLSSRRYTKWSSQL